MQLVSYATEPQALLLLVEPAGSVFGGKQRGRLPWRSWNHFILLVLNLFCGQPASFDKPPPSRLGEARQREEMEMNQVRRLPSANWLVRAETKLIE